MTSALRLPPSMPGTHSMQPSSRLHAASVTPAASRPRLRDEARRDHALLRPHVWGLLHANIGVMAYEMHVHVVERLQMCTSVYE